MYFIFSLVALLCWSGADLFSKKGTSQQDKLSHWKVMFFVGLIMGIHAVITIICSTFIPPVTEGGSPEWWRNIIYTDFKPIDFIHYLPVGFIYLLAMLIGYAGLRYIELSISSPICNSSGSLALIICLLAGLCTALSGLEIAGVILITIGVIGLGVTEYREDNVARLERQKTQNFKYTKSFIALLIPIIYLILDALGTVGDEMIAQNKFLFPMEISEYACNTCMEFTSICFAIFALVWVKLVKKQKFFNFGNSNVKRLAIGGAFETVGQIFYMAVMFSDFSVGIPMISAYCVVSVLFSRIFLKEKLTWKHYLTIIITLSGIIALGISEIV